MRVTRVLAAGVGVLATALGCRASNTSTVDAGGGESRPLQPAASAGVIPGIQPAVFLGTLVNPDAGNAAAAAQGRQLFVAYNCSGCHGGRAGGGMGPNLRDSTARIYGNSDTQLFSTISEGRPAGMPAWGAKLPASEIWKLITYIRTLGTPEEPDRVTVPQPGE
jgi:cytochrome c oxidase cbb3-type subunit III